MHLAADKLRLIITGKCNLDCFYCHNEGQAKEDTFARLADLRRFADVILAAKGRVAEVTVSGGEPLLHPHLVDIVRLAASVGERVTMVSNGLLADSERLGLLAGAGLRKLRLGVDSLDPVKPRPSPGRLAEPFAAADVLATAAEAGLAVDLNVVLTRYNRDQIGDLIRFAVAHRVSIKFFEHVEVGFFGADGSGGSMLAKPHIAVDEFVAAARDALGSHIAFTPAERFGRANLIHRAGQVEVRYCRFLCDYGLCWLTGTRIDPQGYVYNCMSNRGMDRLDPGLESGDIARMITRASSRPCRADPTAPDGT